MLCLSHNGRISTKSKTILNDKIEMHVLSRFICMSKIAEIASGLSSAEVTRACDDAAKEAVLHNDAVLTQEILFEAFERRKTGKALFTS